VHKQDLQNYWDEASKVKANCIPRNVLSLENMFDLQTKFMKLMNKKNKRLYHDAFPSKLRNPWASQVHQSRCLLFKGREAYIHTIVQEISWCILLEIWRYEYLWHMYYSTHDSYLRRCQAISIEVVKDTSDTWTTHSERTKEAARHPNHLQSS